MTDNGNEQDASQRSATPRDPTAAEASRAWCQIDDRLGNPGKDDPITEALHVLAEFIEANHASLYDR